MLLRVCFPVALALVAGSFGASAAPAAPVPAHLMPKPDFFYPTTVGARHVSIWNRKELVEVVSKVEKADDGFVVEVEAVDPKGGRTHSETVLVTARGLARTYSGGLKLASPCRMLVLPHGETNEWETFWGSQKETLRTVGWEEIEVPAGKIRALRVDHDEDGDGASDSSFWYAPGIGCVNWYSAGSKVGRPLKAFTLGK